MPGEGWGLAREFVGAALSVPRHMIFPIGLVAHSILPASNKGYTVSRLPRRQISGLPLPSKPVLSIMWGTA